MTTVEVLKTRLPCSGMDVRSGDGCLGVATGALTGEIWDGEAASGPLLPLTWTPAGPPATPVYYHCACGLSCVRWGANSSVLLCGGDDGAIHAFETASGASDEAFAAHGHDDAVTALSVNPSDGTLLSASWDGTVRLWPAELHGDAAPLSVFVAANGARSRVHSVAWCDPNTLVSAADGGQLCMWDRRTPPDEGPVQATAASELPLLCVAAAPQAIACGDEDGYIRMFDVRALTALGLHATQAHSRAVTAVAFGGDGNGALASGGEDGVVRVVSLAQQTVLHQALLHNGEFVTAVAWATPTTLLSAGRDRRVVATTITPPS